MGLVVAPKEDNAHLCTLVMKNDCIAIIIFKIYATLTLTLKICTQKYKECKESITSTFIIIVKNIFEEIQRMQRHHNYNIYYTDVAQFWEMKRVNFNFVSFLY